MREILFRGKRVDNGQWSYGDLVTCIDRLYIHPKSNSFHVKESGLSSLIVLREVIPETVGQFTGLYDKNGKRIFDRDILSFETMRGTISFTVYYDEECGVWQPFGDSYCGFDPKDVEVIGNIHDNKELLNEN